MNNQDLVTKLLNLTTSLTGGTISTADAIDSLKDIISHANLPEEPNVYGYYLARDGSNLIFTLDSDGDWSGFKIASNGDNYPLRIRNTKDKTQYFCWSDLVDMTPDSAFPLVPIVDVENLKLDFTIKGEDDD